MVKVTQDPIAPVAILVYRRPALVEGLMRALEKARPRRLWILADGPRGDRGMEEAELCRATRKVAEEGVTWECEVRKVYAENNLGLKKGVETGLTALFKMEEKAIVLEEDCHPVPEFFRFCSEMLMRYRNETQVAAISGNCCLPQAARPEGDYFFSRYLHIWGWATWARAWNTYDPKAWAWPGEGFRSYFPEAEEVERRYWDRIYGRVKKGEIQTWDYPWVSHLWSRGWVSITPSENMVANRGFGPDATNTRDSSVEVGIERLNPLHSPYRSPAGQIRADKVLDQQVFRNHFLRTEGRLPLFARMFRSIRKRWQAV